MVKRPRLVASLANLMTFLRAGSDGYRMYSLDEQRPGHTRRRRSPTRLSRRIAA